MRGRLSSDWSRTNGNGAGLWPLRARASDRQPQCSCARNLGAEAVGTGAQYAKRRSPELTVRRAEELISARPRGRSEQLPGSLRQSIFPGGRCGPRGGDYAEAERALALNPSFVPARIPLWTANWTAGRLETAAEYPDAALRLGPHDTLAYVYLGEKGDGLFTPSRYEEAIEFFKRSIAANPEYAPSYITLTASLALAGHEAEASETLRRYLALPLDIPKTITQLKVRHMELIIGNPFFPIVFACALFAAAFGIAAFVAKSAFIGSIAPPTIFLIAYYMTYQKIPGFRPLEHRTRCSMLFRLRQSVRSCSRKFLPHFLRVQ